MKMFHKILAIVLTVFMLVTALPISAIAGAWLEVDAETNGSSSTVTVTVDGGALADILLENGISADLIKDLWAKKAIDLNSLKEIISLEELFEIVPKDSVLSLFNFEEIASAIGLDVLRRYVDIPSLLQDVDTAKLVALIKNVPDLEKYVDVEALLVERYIASALILSYLDEDALFAALNVNTLKKELLSLSIDQLKQIVHVDEVVKAELLNLNAIVNFPAVKEKLQTLTNAQLMSYITDKTALSDQVKSKLSTLSGSVLKGYINDTSDLESALLGMNTADLRDYISDLETLNDKLGAKFDAMSTADLRSYITNESVLANKLTPKFTAMSSATIMSYITDADLLASKMNGKFLAMTDGHAVEVYITDVVAVEAYLEGKYTPAELLPYVVDGELDFKALLTDGMLTAGDLLDRDLIDVTKAVTNGIITPSELMEWNVMNLSALVDNGVVSASDLMDWNIVNLQKLIADDVITAEQLLDWNIVNFTKLVNDKINAADLLDCANLAKVVEDGVVTAKELLEWDVANLSKLVDDGVIVLDMDAVKTELNNIDPAKLKDPKYSDLDKALEVLGVDKCAEMVGGYAAAKKYIDIESLLGALDLKGITDAILAKGKSLDDYIDFNGLLGQMSIKALMDVIPPAKIFAQLSNDEIVELLGMINVEQYVRPVLTTVFNKAMLNVDKVTLNGYNVATENATTKVLSFHSANLVKALASVIPTPAEFAAMKDGKLITLDLGLVYTVDGTTTQKTKNITVEFVIEGDLSRLQNAVASLEALVKSYINKLEFANGILTLDVTLPGTAARLFANVLDSDTIPEELKQKVLNLANLDGNGALAFVDALTLEELLTLFDRIEPSALFETFKNISYVQAALDAVSRKTGYNLADLTLDDLVDYATSVPSFERISEIIANKTGRDILGYVESIAGKVDSIVDRVEKIGAVERILDKVSAKINVDLSAISAADIVDRAKDEPISETIANVIKSKLGVDILAILNTYTVDELYELALDKAANYEAQYNKVRNYIQLLAAYLPDELTSNSIADAYEGNGVFAVSGSKTINAGAFIEKLLRKITNRISIPEEAIELILENVRVGEVTFGLDLTVRATNIYQITYMNRDGDRELFKVFLPAGADLSIFKYDTEISGFEFTGWTDENGVEILTMPAADTVVYADRNMILVHFQDVDGKLLGTIPMHTGDTLADHADKVAEIMGLVTIPAFNAHIIDRYDISWVVQAEESYTLGNDVQLTADTTLKAALTPEYHFTFDIDVPFEITEDNGVYTLTILGDLPEAFKLNLANNVFLKRANGADDVTLKVVIENGNYTFLTLKDATLAQIYNAQGAEVVFDYAAQATAPAGFAGTAYATAADTAFYSFDILSNGAKVTDAFAAPIRIQVPFAAAIENAADKATRVHTVAAGERELITSIGVVTDGSAKYVWFEAPHFSDYVIATEYLVTVNFTDGQNAINGTMAGVDPADMYFPAGEKLTLNFTVESGYTIEKIEALVAGNTTEYNLGDEFTVTDAVAFTVTATTGGYNVYYYVNGALKEVVPYTRDDVASFTTADAFLKPFATVTAGATAPAGYKNTGKWVGFDQSLLGVSDIYVSAKWDAIVYTVEFKGAASFQVTVENYASIVVEPAVPEKAGEYGAWEAYDLSKLVERATASNGYIYTINATYQKLTYDVIVDGNVTAAPTTATAGDQITLTVTQKTGYDATVSVKTANGTDVTVTDGKFTMPAANVYVTVTYTAKTLSYTINGVAGTGTYGESITFEVTLPAGHVLIQAPNAALVSVTGEGARVLTYAFSLVDDGTAITYDTAEAFPSIFKIFNGKLFDGKGDPVSTEKHVTFNSWSAAVAGIFSFASFTVTYTQSLLWLWILIAVLVLIAIIAILYTLYINGKIRRPLFLLRFIAWLVGLFFALCLAVSGLFLKVAHLFGKSEDPEDYGFDKAPVEDAAPVEEATEEEVPAEATDAPAEATDAPAEATDAPAEATDAPAEATEAPAEATDAPAEATDAPAEATDAPAEATEETPADGETDKK